MIRTQVSLEEETYRRVKVEARRLGISIAEVVRRALERALAEAPSTLEKPWMRLAGSLRSGDPDASSTVDDVVYGTRR